MLIQPHAPETEKRMTTFYKSLNERDRRRFAAIEADRLGYGGQSYIVRLLGCDYKTVRRGLKELDNPPDLEPGRIRKKGGT